MTVSDLLEQPCNKSDNINKVATSCYQLLPNLLTTWDKKWEHNLLTACRQTCYKMRFLHLYKYHDKKTINEKMNGAMNQLPPSMNYSINQSIDRLIISKMLV